MSYYKSAFFYGFVIFAMFFGSGNIILPLQVGYISGVNWVWGFLGLFVTGIILPFLGFIAIKLHKGDYNIFFEQEAGYVAKIILPFFIVSLIGPFGVIPRCAAVAHGGVQYIFPNIDLVTFSCIFMSVIFLLCIKDKIMMKVLGKYLSPIKLISLTTLVVVGFLYSHTGEYTIDETKSFSFGISTAYQTMDLFGAFFFASIILDQIRRHIGNANERDFFKFVIVSGAIGFGTLAIIYFGLVYLSAHYAFLFTENTSSKQMLPIIATYVMGNYAAVFIACTMFFSCLATAVALNNVYTKFICNILNIKQNKYIYILMITTIIAFAMSLLDVRGIESFLMPILEVSYPGLIAVTIASICYRKPHKIKIYAFWMITTLMMMKYI